MMRKLKKRMREEERIERGKIRRTEVEVEKVSREEH